MWYHVSRGSRRRQQTVTSTSSNGLNNSKQLLRRSPGGQNRGFRRSEGPDDQRTTSPPASPRSPPSDFPSLLAWYFQRSTVGAAVGGCLEQTLSSRYSHVDTLFSAQMEFSEQLAICGSSEGVFPSLLHEVFWYMMDKTTGTHIRDEECFFYSWNYRQICKMLLARTNY